MRKVHIVKGHVVNVYWIDTAYVQNNTPNEFSEMVIIQLKGIEIFLGMN